MRIGSTRVRQPGRRSAVVALGLLLSACAADYRGVELPPENTTVDPLTLERQIAATAIGARVSFHFNDFYSLMSPNLSTGCAGDARRYRYPYSIAASGEFEPFPTSSLDPTKTIKPDFIKNVSVDLTDANSELTSNRAGACSYGTGLGLPEPTHCATFDYGATGGVNSSLGGTLLLVGGIQSYNYAGGGSTASCGLIDATQTNTCANSTLALAIETLPASTATDPPSALAPGLTSASSAISSWANLGAAAGYQGPDGLAGAGAAFDSVGRNFLLFGGSSALEVGGDSVGQTSSGTWLLELATNKWSHIAALGNSKVDSKILTLLDGSTPLQKTNESRMLFGYVSVPDMAFNGMTTADVDTVDASKVDKTDRIVIVGGIGAGGPLLDTRRFNPTYAPEWVDRMNLPGQNQWLDSYHTQLMNNSSNAGSHLSVDLPPRATTPASPNLPVAFGSVAVRDNVASEGHVLVMGGFDSATETNTATGTGCEDLTKCGGVSLTKKGIGPVDKTDFISLPNASGVLASPVQWTELTEDTNTVPWYGGSTLLPGFDLANNEVVYFGGTSCRNYLTASQGSCSFGNPGRYWQLTAQPGNNTNTFINTAFDVSDMAPPKYAGMAAARGVDPAGNVVILAWGGAQAARTSAPANKVFAMIWSGGAPKWFDITVSASPTGLANAAMAFSHVTGKFYVFGGFSPTTNYLSADTWQLEFTGAGACLDEASCPLKWTKLNDDSRFSCYPSCPTARHSHRMLETNYYNRNPGGSLAANGESTCSADQPCSFGIFMEGGTQTATGIDLAADRWMFDPTANGVGQWLRMGELPPRTLPAMTAIEYKLPSTNTTVRRALLFGGETGMQSPKGEVAGKYFVAPTLGDTLLFDFDKKQWNRVELLGKGYKAGLPASPEWDRREAYDAADPTNAASGTPTNDLSVMSPPPLAGAVMVTRTHRVNANGQLVPLELPEAYLLGGRQKDGTPLPLTQVYKFCAGTTGEMSALNDARCDYYDSDLNPNLVVPSAKYQGRWLLKKPDGLAAPATANRHAYLSAGTYDSVRDRIVLLGGLYYTDPDGNGARAVTQPTGQTGSTEVLEYTPATKVASATASEINGSWEQIPACVVAGEETPAARYGHSLSYDPTRRRLILVGGYSLAGTPLTQTVTDWSGSYDTPEVWAGIRIGQDVLAGEIAGVPAISDAPCYYWRKISTFGNTRFGDPSQAPPQTGISHATSLYLPSAGYNSGYYTMFDNACEYQGPIASTEPALNKLLAGGAYIDIDRSKLGPNENLLLNLTYIPLGVGDLRPDSREFSEPEAAVFKVHLIRTGQTADSLMQIFQPRYFTYTASAQFPQIAQSISVLAPPTGQIREEQVLIPLMMDPSIDRIRIERYSGSGILIDVGIFRMGYR